MPNKPSPMEVKRIRGAQVLRFTLVELLIVVAIITILFAISLPALNSTRDRARAISCLANLKNMGMAELIYASDYNDFIPYYAGDPEKPWHEFLAESYQNATAGNSKLCPSFPPGKYDASDSKAKFYVYGAYNNDYTTFKGGYGTIKVYIGSQSFAFWNLRVLNKLSDHPLLLDSISGDKQRQYFVALPNYNGSATSPMLHLRHGNAGNIVFMDGHVKAATLADLSQLNSSLKTEWHPNYPKTFSEAYCSSGTIAIGY